MLGGLPAGLETAVFRVAQEALTNVARHARASAVRVELGHLVGVPPGTAGTLRLDVSDDGRGIGSEPTGGSLGLLGMRERAEAWGGSVSVGPLEGAGTRVTARFVVPRPLAP